MAGGAGEGDHGLRLRLLEHRLERRIDRRRVEPGAPDISLGDIAVGLGDADQLDVLGVPVPGQEPRRMAVFQAGHAEPQRRRSRPAHRPGRQRPEERPTFHPRLLSSIHRKNR